MRRERNKTYCVDCFFSHDKASSCHIPEIINKEGCANFTPLCRDCVYRFHYMCIADNLPLDKKDKFMAACDKFKKKINGIKIYEQREQ